MPSFDVVILITALIGNIFLGLFTYLKNPKSATNRLFFLFISSLVTYLLFNFLLTIQKTDTGAFLWVKLVMSNAVMINILFFLFSKTFPQQKLEVKKIIFWSSIVFTALLVLAAQLNLVFTSVNVVEKMGGGQPGIAMPLFLLHTILFLGGGFVSLIRKYKKSHGIEEVQTRLFLLGAILMFVLILTTNLFLVLIFNTSAFVGLLPIYTLIFAGFISYAIIKHRFLDIRLIVARSVAYFLFVFIAFIFIALVISIVNAFVTGIPVTPYSLITFVFLALVVAFSYRPIEGLFEKMTEKVFYRHSYDSRTFLSNMGRMMASSLSLSFLVEMILKELFSKMKVRFAFLILTRNHSIIWVKGGGDTIPNPEFNEGKICELIKKTVDSFGENLLVFDEMNDSEDKNTMRDHNINVLLPLVVKDEVIGALLLGEKSSGDIYSSDDIEVLKILVPEVAVAVRNALSYEEIKRFNVTLEQEVKLATESLQRANERLLQLDKLKDEFVSLASHELRTPMTVIKSYVWLMLQGKTGNLNDKQKTYLKRTYASTDRLINLVNDMLNVSRIESGRFTLDIKPFDIKKLTEEVIGQLSPKAQEQGIALFVDDSVGESLIVNADPEKIEQVLVNLVGNSLKFTPSGGKIIVSFSKNGETIETHVFDTGKGINKEDLPKLFQKFGVVGNDYLKKQNTQGTGLGLYLSKSIIGLQGGKIWADSEGEDKGCTFSFSLKAVKDKIDS